MFLGSLMNQPCCPSLVVKMQTLATQYGVGPKTMVAMQQSILAQRQAMSNLTKDQLANISEKNNMIKPVVDSILAEKDDAKLAGLWADGEQALIGIVGASRAIRTRL